MCHFSRFGLGESFIALPPYHPSPTRRQFPVPDQCELAPFRGVHCSPVFVLKPGPLARAIPPIMEIFIVPYLSRISCMSFVFFFLDNLASPSFFLFQEPASFSVNPPHSPDFLAKAFCYCLHPAQRFFLDFRTRAFPRRRQLELCKRGPPPVLPNSP